MPKKPPASAANTLLPSAEKRRPPAAGMGRKKGVPNKTTKTLREAIEASFDKVGGAAYLVRMATEQPVAYMGLLAKVLPHQVQMQSNTPIEVVFKTV